MKIVIAVFCFSKAYIVGGWQGSGNASGSEYSRFLNSPEFRTCLWFWMCQSFGYTRVLNMLLVLNMRGFWIYQSSEYVRVAQCSEYAWIVPEYAWICLIMSGCVWICLNLPEWLLFHIFHFPFVLQFIFYFKTRLLPWTSTGD